MTEQEIAALLHQQPAGRVRRKDGATIPVFSMRAFINTVEGWNLYFECHDRKDMRPYEEAKAAWEARGCPMK